MRIVAYQDETMCLKTRTHHFAHSGENHYCYRCGMYDGKCDCPELGTLLDY